MSLIGRSKGQRTLISNNTFKNDLPKYKKILKKGGIILIHRDKKNLDVFPDGFKILVTKNYGRSKIIFGTLD